MGWGYIHGFNFSHDAELVQWFMDRNEFFTIFADVVAMLQSIGATHTLTKYSLCAQETAKNILLGYEIEASIRDLFSNVLPSILVGNKKDITGGAYECLVGYIKHYSIWHPRGAQLSSDLRTIIWEGTTTVTRRLKRIRNALTTDTELKELSIHLATNSADFISEFIRFFTSQYEEYTETSTFPPEQALTNVLDLTALVFEELHGVRVEVMDAGQHFPGVFLWGFIKAW